MSSFPSQDSPAGDPAAPLSQDGAISPEERQATIDRLCAHFASDGMTETELERRLDIAYAARTLAELAALVRDLPPLVAQARASTPARRASGSVPIDPEQPIQENDLLVSVWGSTERKGSWIPARRLTAVTVMGGTDLDFRQATFATREVSIRVFALMGGVDIVIPPGVHVDWRGVALMGGVATPERSASPAPDAPVVRISGLVCMGAVEVVERLPGETARDARKRIRRHRKERRPVA